MPKFKCDILGDFQTLCLKALSSGADMSAKKELIAKIQAAYPPARVTGTLAKKSHSFLESKYTAQKTRMI